ncbi:MAG TPA: tetratricopeptide repeat protein, partial [Acidobacteriota bacterium]
RNDTRCATAETYYDRKQYNEARQQLQTVLKEEPANLRALRLAASISMDTKKYEEALQTLDSLLKIDPTDVRALSHKARLLSYLQRDQDALRAYETLVSYRPLEEQEAIQVAAIYLTAKNVGAAERYFRLALNSNEQSIPAWQGLGLILAAQQNWIAAFEAFVNAGDCEKASDMINKQQDIPARHMEVYRQKCPE